MTASLVLLAALAAGPGPARVTLPARVLPLPTDPAHLRVDGERLYLSGFHSGKLVMVPTAGARPVKELRLDASGGDLVLANGKVFVGQVFRGSLLVADQATLRPIRRLPLGGEGCLA